MQRSVYLPSYLISGENETSLSSPDFKHCEVDTDCNNQLLCYNFKKLTWLNGKAYENLDFYQHDNVVGSFNYIKYTQKPQYNFCGCPTTGGWYGYDCTSYHGSNHFQIFVMLFAIFILSGIICIGIYDLIMQVRTYGRKKINNRTSIALMFCIVSAVFLVIGRIFLIYAVNQPLLFSPQPNGRRIFPSITAVSGWTNNLSVIFAIMCLLQISYCWIEVSHNVAKMKKGSQKYNRIQKAILILEGMVMLACAILTVTGMINYCIFALGPCGIIILLLNTVGARNMISMMNEVLTTEEGVPLSSFQVEYRAIVVSINRTSKLITFFITLAISAGIATFVLSLADPTNMAYTPGLWHRPMFWWYDFLYSFVFNLMLLSAFLYLHPRVTIKKKDDAGKNRATVQDQGKTNGQEIAPLKSPGDHKSEIQGSNQVDHSFDSKRTNP